MPNVVVSCGVTIGSHCVTKMREDISIGTGTLVGLGSNVLSDLPAGVIAVGSPAKVIRKTCQ